MQDAYKEALAIIEKCCGKHGFLASPEEYTNYKRVWSRDGVITGLASLFIGEKKFIDTFKKTLDTLLKYGGKQGEIPSNVNPKEGKVSYGRYAGRVDADLWYIIGCERYYEHTKDTEFLERHYPFIKKVVELLECWEFNRRDFLFVPKGGDWADEMPRSGYLLYDQILYFLALEKFQTLQKENKESPEKIRYTKAKKERLKKKIQINFWPAEEGPKEEEYIYHRPVFGQMPVRSFWAENFTPGGGRFDAFANILAILSGISEESRNTEVIKYISTLTKNGLLPAFHPPIYRESNKWKNLLTNYSFTFKNKPYLRHNGGIWPFLNGLYAAALRKTGRQDLAERYAEMVAEANRLHKEKNKEWGFYEYLHGKKHTPQGHPYMAWNAAGQIIAMNHDHNIL